MTNTDNLTLSKEYQFQDSNNETTLHPEKTRQALKNIDLTINILLGLIAILVVCGVFIQVMTYSL